MFVVGWNREQGEALTIETLNEHIQYNLDAFHEDTSASWAMIGLFKTHEEATVFCNQVMEIRNKRLGEKDSVK